jgi:hypothetical protein
MTTPAELWIFNSLNHIAFGVDHIYYPGNADGSALWVDKRLCIRDKKTYFLIFFNLGNRVVIANVRGGAAST